MKTCYTGDPESFHKVVEGCPVPVVVLGGEKAETIEQVFSLVHASIEAGGKGIAIGLNIWEHGKTKAMVEAMVGIVHEGWTVKQVLAHVGQGPLVGMPGLAFATNFLWVMVIGLLGPSLPAIVEDLGISTSRSHRNLSPACIDEATERDLALLSRTGRARYARIRWTCASGKEGSSTPPDIRNSSKGG